MDYVHLNSCLKIYFGGELETRPGLISGLDAKPNACVNWKMTDPKGFILYDYAHMTFQKRYKYKDVEAFSACQELGRPSVADHKEAAWEYVFWWGTSVAWLPKWLHNSLHFSKPTEPYATKYTFSRCAALKTLWSLSPSGRLQSMILSPWKESDLPKSHSYFQDPARTRSQALTVPGRCSFQQQLGTLRIVLMLVMTCLSGFPSSYPILLGLPYVSLTRIPVFLPYVRASTSYILCLSL